MSHLVNQSGGSICIEITSRLKAALARYWSIVVVLNLLATCCSTLRGQDEKQIVQQAVQTELHADDTDHSHWMYFDVDHKSNLTVKQWVAETSQGRLKRVLEENGRKLSEHEQRARTNGFIQSHAEQAKQRQNDQHDDKQARQLLSMLPDAFLWTRISHPNGSTIVLHFAPNPHYHPPTFQARVFAAMEGNMTIDSTQHRIVRLEGQLIHDVKFGGGLLGHLRSGGSFDVERRQIANGEWQIVETHVHIIGRILFFKSIADQEDDKKSEFKELPAGLSLNDAEKLLFQQNK